MNTVNFKNQKIAPSKIVCIGRNYVEHIKELGNEIPSSMVVFNKPNSAISKTFYNISDQCHFEGEICFLMKNGKIEGIGFGLDLTKRKLQSYLKEKGLPWERAKGFDRSAVFSDFVKFDGDVRDLRMELYINEGKTQEGGYGLMIYKPKEMIEEIKSFMSFEDGDIVMTGTPKGVSEYKTGDLFTGKVFEGSKLLVEKEWIVK